MRNDLLTQLRDDEADGGVPNLVVYDDATGRAIGPGSLVRGHPTIGFGRCLDRHGISAAEADWLLSNDVDATESALALALPWWQAAGPVRQGVLINMAFQMGVQGLAGFGQLLRHAAAAEWLPAARCGLDSAWAREMAGYGSPRALRLMAQLATGDAATGADWWEGRG